MKYRKTVEKVELSRFMRRWFVIAGRTTFLERGAHNATESYTWNEARKRIDIDFKFNKDSFEGTLKSIPQKGWVENQTTNAHWKVSPFWPIKADYLIIGLDPGYRWTAVGVPSQNYLWIMASTPEMSDGELKKILEQVAATGYSIEEVKRVPQQPGPR